jgi:hypothetical protein
MVLPLIPVALIAVGAVTGSGGLALGGKGALAFKRAQSQVNDARKRYQDRRTQSEARVAETNRVLVEYGEEQKQAFVDVVLRMAEFLRRNEKQVRENERLLVDGVDLNLSQVEGLTGLEVNAASWVAGVLGSVGSFVGVDAAVNGAAIAFGVAGTGTTISELSGAAAGNAALAFLGGGPVAAGGGGMALGATALNFVTLGPALLVGGFVAHTQGDKALSKAAEVKAKVAAEVAKMDLFDTSLSAVDERANELRTVLKRLRVRSVDALELLESEPFDAEKHASRFQHALSLTLAVRDVAMALIVDADGDLTERSSDLTVKYRAMTEDNEDA